MYTRNAKRFEAEARNFKFGYYMDVIKLIVKAGPIQNEAKLIETLGISRCQLRQALALPAEQRYKDPKNPPLKKDGTIRVVKSPVHEIRVIQRKINDHLKRSIQQWPNYLHGSIPKNDKTGTRDYVTCAATHCGAKSILKIDISSFFDRIHFDNVVDIFSGLFRYHFNVAEKIANICCYNSNLVQGALTSSYIANLVFWDIEHKIVARLRKSGLKYTRLVDDITISSKEKNYDFSFAESIIEEMLYSKNLPTNKNKRILAQTGLTPMTVHGLQINHSKPCFPKEHVKKIMSAVHNVKNRALILHQNQSKLYRNMYHRTLGRVNKLSRVKNDKWERLLSIMLAPDVLPEANHGDILVCKKHLAWFDKNKNKHIDKHYYTSKYYYTFHLLHFIKKSPHPEFANFGEQSLIKLDEYKPPQEKK
jgi:RNA-directed DNA polymerase